MTIREAGMARFRLLTEFVSFGVLHHRGSVIEKPDDWKGPMRAVPKTDESGNVLFDKGIKQYVDEPLFELIEDDKASEDHHG